MLTTIRSFRNRLKHPFEQYRSLNAALGHRDWGISDESSSNSSRKAHPYKNLFPFKKFPDFCDYLKASVVYNKDGLIALNKPFGIKIHGHDKPGTRSKDGKRFVIPSISECDFTIEDALPSLMEHLNVSNLTIAKSAERYTSGLVLLTSNEKALISLQKSFGRAKSEQKPNLIHWFITLGCPVESSRAEKVGIRFLEIEKTGNRQPVIVDKFSKREVKEQKVYSVQVEYKILASNKSCNTSLVQISTSSVKFHFVRVYAANRASAILGDIMYSSRVNIMLGMPVNIHVQHAMAYDMPSLPKKMSEKLQLPSGSTGHSMMPTMLHLRSIFLPSFKGEDLTITAEPPSHFTWTTEMLNLSQS